VQGTLAYLRPLSWVVHGITGETSGFSPGEFYLWIVRMPLYTPTDHLTLDWSERVPNGATTLDPNGPTTADVVRSAIDRVEREFADYRLDPKADGKNVRLQEDWAYALLLEGRPRDASKLLRRVTDADTTYAWVQELVDRASGMRDLIETGRVDEAKARLAEWRLTSLDALGLDPT
jgi:hypothetical protein